MSSKLDALIGTRIRESIEVKQQLLQGPHIETLRDISLAVAKSLENGGKVLFAGNGGSFADAFHLAGEFVSRFTMEREPLSSVALGGNNSILTAIGNDYGYEDVFLREIKALGRPGDVFIGISTSGNSPNIVACIEAARDLGITCFGMTGSKPCRMHELCDCLKVPSPCTPRIQESHILAGHILCEIVEHLRCDPEFEI